MKVILSRKGFDSGAGKMPSPIMPDGTLLSMPIPSDDRENYRELFYNNYCYLDIIKQLKHSFSYESCHLDPDIRRGVLPRPNDWCAAFGQADIALKHLNNQGVKEGDIFLFWGWFKQTEYDVFRKLRYVKDAPDLHIIYGYLQIGSILDNWSDMHKVTPWHPHAALRRQYDKMNTIYVASKQLLDTQYPGYGLFKYSEKLVLTNPKETRSRWILPECLLGKKMSYHSSKNYKDGYFQSAARGQEFVVEADDAVCNWIEGLMQYRE